MQPLTKLSRLLLALGSLAMIATFFLPLWQIQLWAPQYPEGLNMKIWHNHLSGAFDIINGLNHYIGMREIKQEMFPEFQFLGPLMGAFIVLGLLMAWWGTRRALVVFISTTYLLGLLALYDFYRWGYDYGHNLDDHAAIKVPGMAYQPPVLGYKNLLNFTAYSGPDQGGWIVVVVGVLATLLLVYELGWAHKKQQKAMLGGALLVAMLGLSACSAQPQPLKMGQDACHLCKMTLTDTQFGAELVTQKGKVYVFDDISCLISFIKTDALPATDIAHQVGIDYQNPGQWVSLPQAFFLRHPDLKSPMRSDIAVFSTEADRTALKATLGEGATELSWNDLFNQ